jgi:periplasmic protein TonB
MFDDFQPSATSQQSRVRFRNSVAVAVVFYGVSSAAIVAATNQVRKIIEEKEEKVEFAPPPEPPPPPPPPPPPVQAATPPPSARPKMKRPELAPPDKISDEKLKESDKALVDPGDTGPVDGFLTGTIGGTGTKAPPPPPPPPPPLAPLIAPVAAGLIERPRYPSPAKRKGIEGTVVVEFEILENGSVANPRIISGPTEFHDVVLRQVVTWHFRPASRGGKPVRYRMRKSIVFRLEDG